MCTGVLRNSFVKFVWYEVMEFDIGSLFLHKLRLHSKVDLSIGHSAFVKGDQTNFEIEPSFGVKASELYRDVKYTTVDEYLNQFV
jgi:hypothetical protein